MSGVRKCLDLDRYFYVMDRDKYDDWDCMTSRFWQIRILWFTFGRIKRFKANHEYL